MSYKNSVKLFVSNFNLVWKQLVYLLICAGICALVFLTMLKPITSLLEENGVFLDFKNIVQTVYDQPKEIALMFSDAFKHFFNVLSSNFSTIWLELIGLLILGVLLPYILVQMSFYNISSILYQKLSMNMNVKYVQNATQTFKSSLKYAFANIIFNLPFIVLSFLFVYFYTLAATSITNAIIGLITLSALLIITNSIKISIFTYYVGYMVANDANPFVAFGKGLVNVFKNFWKVLGMSIIILLTIIFVNSFIMVFTFFAGLIVLIPASFVFLSIYYLVIYFNIKGERYYLSPNLIFNPVKYVVKQDENFNQMDIPEETKEIQVTTTKIKKKKKTKSN